jgi:hypothetical protein
MGDVRDGWATEYARKAFSATVDEDDWLHWIHESVVEPDMEVPLQEIPREVKSRVMRLLVYTETAQALADWGVHEQDEGLKQRGESDVAAYKSELEQWAQAMKAKFGAGSD